MNFAFSEEQEELRRRGAAVPGGQVARDGSAPADGDDRGLRPRGLEADGPGARAAGPRTSPRSTAARASRSSSSASCSRRWAACCCARRTSRRSCSRRTRSSNAGTDARSRRCCPGIARGDTIADARVHRAERASGTRPASRWRRPRPGDGYTLDGEKMFVIDGHTADLIVVVARTAGTTRRPTASRSSPSPATPTGLTRTPLATMDTDPQAGEARVRRASRPTPLGDAGQRLARVLEDARPGRGRARQRDDGRRAEGARDVGRVREGARAVRPADRLVPGDQAQVRRHAARGRVGQVGRVLRVVGRRRGQRRAAGGRRARRRRTAPRRTSTPPPRTSRSTVASASRGSTPRTSTSSARRAPRSTSATPRTTASCSPSASAI